MANWDGAQYADVSALQRMVAEESIRGIELKGDERLLDVGCGDGFITMLLADRLPDGSVVGVDASRGMIAKALTRVAEDELRVQFHVDDALALPFDGDFDVVVSFNALHWVHDQPAALRGIARSLVDGGRAVVQMVCAAERLSIEAVADEVAARPHWAGHFAGIAPPYFHVEPTVFAGWAVQAGFTVADLEVRELSWKFDSSKEFRDWFAAGASDWTDRLPDSDRTTFAAEVIDRYEQDSGEPGTFRFSQMRVVLTR